MNKLILLSFLFYSLHVFAAETLEFNSKFNVYSQKIGAEFSLPIALSEKIELNAKIELPTSNDIKLKKVFTQTFSIKEFKTIFEIYYFNQNNQRYLSQQVYLYKDNQLITRCTSYFGLNQNYLVPGSCGGVQGTALYGVALYKI